MADPTTVTGLVYRWKASSLALSNGAAVTSWPALVGGSGATLTNGTATAPTYQTAGIGGQPAVKFVTANTQSMGTGTITAQAQPMTVVVVHQLTRTDTTIQEIFAGNTPQIITIGGATGYDCFAGNDLATGTLTTAARALTYVINGASSAIYLEGTSGTTGDAGAGTIGTSLMIGNHQTANTRWLDGSIAEILVYSQALNATDRSTVHSYIQDLYGITVSDYVPSTGPPTGLAATVISSTEIDLSWNAVTSAAGYDLRRNGVVIASGLTGLSYADTGLTPSTTYTYNVRTVY